MNRKAFYILIRTYGIRTRPPLEASSSRRKAADCRSVTTLVNAQNRILYVPVILRFF